MTRGKETAYLTTHLPDETIAELNGIAQHYLPRDFIYTTLYCTKDSLPCLHVDSGNIGWSAIMGAGDYMKGRFAYEGAGWLSIDGQMMLIDGNVPHLSE